MDISLTPHEFLQKEVKKLSDVFFCAELKIVTKTKTTTTSVLLYLNDVKQQLKP